MNTLKILRHVDADPRVLFGLDWNPHLMLFLETLGKVVSPTLFAIRLWAVCNRRLLLEELVGALHATPAEVIPERQAGFRLRR